MKRGDKTIMFLMAICSILFLIRIVIQTDINTQSDTYIGIEQQVKNQDVVNSDIRNRIYAFSSLQRIDQEAKKQGFVDTKNYYIVK